MDIDFEPPATIEMVDEGVKLSTINRTVDAKGELLAERTPKAVRLGYPCAQPDKSSRLRTNRHRVQSMRAIGNP